MLAKILWVIIVTSNESHGVSDIRSVECFSCDQAEHFFPSVHLFVRLSFTRFWQCPCHLIILKISGVIATDRGDVHGRGQSQMWKVKVTEVKATFAPIWAFPNCNSSEFEFTDGCEMMHMAWSAIEELPYCFSKSSMKSQFHTGKKSKIWIQFEIDH